MRNDIPATRCIAVVGSRGFARLGEVRAYVRSLPQDVVIVSGGAMGVDSVAADEAHRCGIRVDEFIPDYARHGRGAPNVRNRDIARRCTEMVAFWDGTSPGTPNAVAWAVYYGRSVTVLGPSLTGEDGPTDRAAALRAAVGERA